MQATVRNSSKRAAASANAASAQALTTTRCHRANADTPVRSGPVLAPPRHGRALTVPGRRRVYTGSRDTLSNSWRGTRHSGTAGASNSSTIVWCDGSWQVYTDNGDTTGITCCLPQPLSRGPCLVAYGARVRIAIDRELAVFATTWTWPPRAVRTETVGGTIAIGVSRSRSVTRNRGTAGRVVAAVGTIVSGVAVDRGIIAGIIDWVLIRMGSGVECIHWIQLNVQERAYTEDHGPEQTGTTRRYGSLPTGSHHTTGSLLDKHG